MVYLTTIGDSENAKFVYFQKKSIVSIEIMKSFR